MFFPAPVVLVLLLCGCGSDGNIVFERPSADHFFDYYALGSAFSVFVAHDTHAMGAEAAPPACRSVVSGYLACVDKGVVARVANVVVAIVACVAMEASV